jgi:alpha-tubulin suppressor-like RCC1 family protein
MSVARISVVVWLGAAGLGSSLVLAGTAAAVAGPAGPGRPAAAPAIKSFMVTPSRVSAQGGKVTATARVRSARTCAFSIRPKVTGFPVARRCGSGTAKATLKFPPNDSISAKRFTIKLTVRGGGRTVTASRRLTQPPLTLSGVRTVVGQGQSYCALLTNSRVYCWGFNDLGQLGDGKTKNSSRPVAVMGVGGKGVLTGVAGLVSDTLGYGSEYCAVLRAGGVDCWGSNQDGQLGDGRTANSDKPVAVKGIGGSGLLTGVKNVQPEIYGFCAALSSGGAVCWGLNENGQLGDNSLTGPDTCGAIEGPCSTTPVVVVSTSGTGALSHVASLTGEGESMCALLTTSGVDCWGPGPHGELGNGSDSGSPFPVIVKGIGGTGSLTGVTSLTGYKDNGSNICARLGSGKVDCWGEDTWGELGNGTTGIFHDSPVPVAVKGVGGHGTLGAVASVTGIPGLTNCAILTSGGADCWGFNGDSALGNPPAGFTSNVPVKVVGLSGKGVLGGIAGLVTGDNNEGGNVCALLTSGGVDCWGFTSSGYSPTPRPVPGFGPVKPRIRVRSLASDQDGSTCAVLASGGADCWGAGEVGQLGNGTNSPSLIPEAVLAPA